jgi:hypothetical protein
MIGYGEIAGIKRRPSETLAAYNMRPDVKAARVRASGAKPNQIKNPLAPNPPPVDTTPKLAEYQPLTGAAVQQEFESSPWMRMATQRQQAEQALQLNQAGAQAGTQAAMARANLMRGGGLRSGAAERLAGASAESAMMAGQGIRAQGAAERGQLGMQGLGIAAQTVGQNVAGINARNILDYQEKMKQLGAGATAEAIKKSGGGGGFFDNPGKAMSGWFG